MQEKIISKGSIKIDDFNELVTSLKGRWVQQDTAILVIHEMGNQNPLETPDGFARGLVETYQEAGYHLQLEHKLAKKGASDSRTPWFDNYLHIKQENGEGGCLDIYEYYWAAETEEQATLRDLNTWLENVSKGARKFYNDNVEFSLGNGDRKS